MGMIAQKEIKREVSLDYCISPTYTRGGIPPKPPFRPPHLEVEAKRAISSFSLAANSF